MHSEHCDAESRPVLAGPLEDLVKHLCLPQVTPGALQTTTWAPCQRGGLSRAAAPSAAQTGGLSGAARTAGVPPIGAALTPTFLTTSADQMTSIPTSVLATDCVNLRGEEDLYRKKRSGGEGAPGLRSLLTTGSSVRGMAGAQPGAPRGHGKAADLETSDSPGIPRTHAFAGAEKKGGAETLWVYFSFPELLICAPFPQSVSFFTCSLHSPCSAFRLEKLCFFTFMWFFCL